MDAGDACDIVWETLEDVYGRKEDIVEDALRLIMRPAKSIGHERKVLLELRADMRNLLGIVKSIRMESALQRSQLMGGLYSSLTEKLRGRLESQFASEQWTFAIL